MGELMRGALGMMVALSLVGLPSVAVGQGVPQPTPEHERLAKIVGTWDATVKSWMQGPDQQPTVSKGVETVKLMPGGLWVLSEFHGKFGELDFHGAGQSGYDPAKKKYVGTWVDSMETVLTILEGDFDPQTKTLTMHSQGKGPGGTPYEMKTTEVYKDHAHRVFMMFMKFGESKNEYVKMMEISYVRRAEEGAKK